jgi:selenocysteine-specific elongation factor
MNRPCIVGTAGHIDHGKTLLIKMLTGIDTDRLKDEKKRGISIELGFASLTLPSGVRCGVVDVPGHERFIRNMLAGAGGIDVILLVIAADEGVMPQTREHLDIVDLLGASTGIVALTKIDMVEAEWKDLVLEDIREYLSETCLASAPIVPVSSTTGEGKENLLAHLEEAVAEAELTPRGRFTRLPIDRVFTMQGFGTVVTGTLWAGALHEGDRVAVAPAEIESRVKGLQVHSERVPTALPGQRVAVNLHGIPIEKIARGDWLVTPDAPPTTRLIQARLRCVRNSPYPIKNRMRIRFHLGASEILGRIIPLETDQLKPGEEGLVQIRLEGPALAERNDRFVLRSYSPMHTIGGGHIVDVSGTRRRRFRREDIDALHLAEEGTLEDRVLGEVTTRGALGIKESELPAKMGQTATDISPAVEQLLEQKMLRRIGKKMLFATDAVTEAGGLIVAALRDHQEKNSLSWGLLKSELKSRFDSRVHPDLIETWIQEQADAGELHIREDRLRYGTDQIDLSPAHAALTEKILSEIDGRAFAGPSTKELLEALGSHRDAEELITHLVREGEIVRIPPDFLYRASRMDALRRQLREFFSVNSEMNVGAMKQILGVSRKQAVPLLEWCDRQRWTERRGDVRVAGARLEADDS